LLGNRLARIVHAEVILPQAATDNRRIIWTMKRVLYAALLAAALAGPAMARTFPVPSDAPAITVTTPDNWKVSESEYGYYAKSPGEDVYFAVESAKGEKAVGKMMDENESWMKENKIADAKPKVEDGKINGVDIKHFEFDTTDENGKTLVDFFLIPTGNGVAMITFWGSVEERNKHQDDIMSIMNSIKPAK
jgi:hypothetical protein